MDKIDKRIIIEGIIATFLLIVVIISIHDIIQLNTASQIFCEKWGEENNVKTSSGMVSLFDVYKGEIELRCYYDEIKENYKESYIKETHTKKFTIKTKDLRKYIK